MLMILNKAGHCLSTWALETQRKKNPLILSDWMEWQKLHNQELDHVWHKLMRLNGDDWCIISKTVPLPMHSLVKHICLLHQHCCHTKPNWQVCFRTVTIEMAALPFGLKGKSSVIYRKRYKKQRSRLWPLSDCSHFPVRANNNTGKVLLILPISFILTCREQTVNL